MMPAWVWGLNVIVLLAAHGLTIKFMLRRIHSLELALVAKKALLPDQAPTIDIRPKGLQRLTPGSIFQIVADGHVIVRVDAIGPCEVSVL